MESQRLQKSHYIKMDSTRKKETRTPKDNLAEDGDNIAKIQWHHKVPPLKVT